MSINRTLTDKTNNILKDLQLKISNITFQDIFSLLWTLQLKKQKHRNVSNAGPHTGGAKTKTRDTCYATASLDNPCAHTDTQMKVPRLLTETTATTRFQQHPLHSNLLQSIFCL